MSSRAPTSAIVLAAALASAPAAAQSPAPAGTTAPPPDQPNVIVEPPQQTQPAPAPQPNAQQPGAQANAPQEPAQPPPLEPTKRRPFQIGARIEYSHPFGRLSNASGDDMTEAFSGQVPLQLDIAGWLAKNFLLGFYASLAFGGTSGRVKRACDNQQLDCLSASFRLGLQAQAHLSPVGKVDPWFGYGFGVESTGIDAQKNGDRQRLSVVGWDYARFMAGVDFPLMSRAWGGPVVEFSLGQYAHSVTETTNPPLKIDEQIPDKALHYWLGIGAKFSADL